MLFLHNTLTGKKEEFKPITPGFVGMYNCGPTVYNYAHIGNLRAYIFADILRRTLEYNGYKVKQVMNITDVGHLTSDGDDGDDKMVKALKREGKPFTLAAMREIANTYTDAFNEDLRDLNCETPHEMPRASDHIPEDIALIKELEAKGFAYKTSDGMYFDTVRFPSYGRLGNINLKGQLAGARGAVNSEKKNPIDFTLWKVSTNDIGWESPWGKGFPGWHLECSAMSRRYLGQPFDIHTGGIDHIPVHHQNEIAQSEAAYGVPLASFWFHNEHLIVPSGKMAKSGENFLTLRSVEELGLSPIAYRYSLLATHYAKPMNFTLAAIPGARMAFKSFVDAYSNTGEEIGSVNPRYKDEFLQAINNDLNLSVALSIAWSVLNDEKISNADKKATILDFDKVFGFSINDQAKLFKRETQPVPDYIQALARKREETRKAKDFKTSDKLRVEIESAGFEVMDTDSGPLVRKRI